MNDRSTSRTTKKPTGIRNRPQHRAARCAVSPSALATGFVLAYFLIVGQSFAETGGFGQIVDGFDRLAISALKLLVFTVAFTVALTALFRYLDKRQAAEQTDSTSRKSVGSFFSKHAFACSLGILLAAWGLYLVVFAPGTLTWDGARSLNQFTTETHLENHHPVLMNLLYAGLMSLGRLFGSDNLGILFITGFQTLAMALSLAAIVSCMDKLRAPRALIVVTLGYFALFPAWGILAQDAIKDTLFIAVFGFFCLKIALLVLDSNRRASSTDWLVLLSAALLVALTRNNGIYIVVPTLIALAALLWYRKRHATEKLRAKSSAAWATAVLGATCIVYFALTSVVYPLSGIDMRNEKEMLSIPFQQTARYLATYPDDVTAEEFAAIDEVLPADRLADLYYPDLADPIKEEYRLHNTKIEGSFEYAEQHPDALKHYLGAWASMGQRHPGVYVSATIANTYAYFYPFTLIDCEGGRPIMLIGHVGEPINLTYDVNYLMPAEIVQGAADAVNATTVVPGLNVLYSPAPYVWLLLIAAVCLVRVRQWDRLILCLPSAMLLLTVLAGPLNGHLRYVMPIIFVLPLIWAVVLYRTSAQQERETRCRTTESSI